MIGGDSVTMGVGVLEEETYPARLEALLNHGSTKVRYEVLNLGVAALNASAIVSRLEYFSRSFDPDLVIYGFTINDIEGPKYRRTADRAGRKALWPHWRFAGSSFYLLRILWPRWFALRELFFPTQGSYIYALDENYFHNPPAWADFLSHLDRLAALGAAQGACVHMFIHTHLSHLNLFHPFQRIYRRVADAARERGMAITQSLPALRGRDQDRLRLSAFNPHPSPAGHEAFAEVLYEGLMRLPTSCWPSEKRPDSFRQTRKISTLAK
jgi:lysophospholipase L1-like esterase